MNATEKMLFDAVKKQNDGMACSTIGLFAAPDKEFEPDAEVPDLNLHDDDGFTLLHYAVKRGLRATVSRLLEKGAAVDTKDKIGNTPLLLAIKKLPDRNINDSDIYLSSHSDTLKIVQILVEYHADINSVDPSEYGSGYTCLHLAVSQNHYLALRALLTKQEDSAKCLEVIDLMGQTPLHLAALKGDVFIVGYILNEIKANPNFQSPTLGYTPLHFAANGNKAQVIPLLVNAGADLSIGTKRDAKQTPLIMAQKMKHKEAASAIEDVIKKSTSREAKIAETSIRQSDVIAKSFVSSPIYQEKGIADRERKISVMCGSIEIIFEKAFASFWKLEVLNTKKSPDKPYSMLFEEQKDKVYNHLQREDISGLIEFLEPCGHSGREIAQYMREGISVETFTKKI